MSAPDRDFPDTVRLGLSVSGRLCDFGDPYGTEYLRSDGPTITAYREALRLLGADPDSIAREAEKEAQNG